MIEGHIDLLHQKIPVYVETFYMAGSPVKESLKETFSVTNEMFLRLNGEIGLTATWKGDTLTIMSFSKRKITETTEDINQLISEL